VLLENKVMLQTAPLPFDLSDQLVVITGGGSGIGLGVARCMAAAGAKVVLIGRNAEKLDAATRELGEQAAAYVHDITDLAGNPALVDRIEADHGPIATLVNNAGVHLKKPATEVSDEEFQSVMQTHVNAAFSLARECGKGMLERRKGHILFMASMASYMGLPQVVAYSAAKAAYLGIVQSLTAEFAPSNVRVNAIAPGWIHTELMHKAVDSDPERKAKILGRTPMNDFGDPEDIGWAAVYLSSPAAKFVTGVCLPVDGGALYGF
jgi:NAD(P)-dependent dehydrogenase (short-subunit alcohol dehydrogenase family)